jgi:hypothetical protein
MNSNLSYQLMLLVSASLKILIVPSMSTLFQWGTVTTMSISIVAGTSIGGINAAIIAGSVDKNHPESTLQDFWLELAENSKFD